MPLLLYKQSVLWLSVVCLSHSLERELVEVRSYAVFIFKHAMLSMMLGPEQKRKMVSRGVR